MWKRGLDPYSEWDQLEKLGDGAFGDVFKVRNKVRRDYAAAKVIELGNEEEMEEHYNEIAILAKINHPNIVKLVDGIFYEKKLWEGASINIYPCFLVNPEKYYLATDSGKTISLD